MNQALGVGQSLSDRLYILTHQKLLELIECTSGLLFRGGLPINQVNAAILSGKSDTNSPILKAWKAWLVLDEIRRIAIDHVSRKAILPTSLLAYHFSFFISFKMLFSSMISNNF
ncbi:hypothetical protein KIN20_025629 [Parelaphostrongylus tenuis]|uniref:Uncharacterized protein n=1 Tax=Parelaphostrongylus tenuis TaxID=148309 RepID=A0AAD5MVK4_PARTN|nr:hypothetical protein KIN20_025629 [Parelaphostrongylus tenuis]